jgi:hypothetical protein
MYGEDIEQVLGEINLAELFPQKLHRYTGEILEKTRLSMGARRL